MESVGCWGDLSVGWLPRNWNHGASTTHLSDMVNTRLVCRPIYIVLVAVSCRAYNRLGDFSAIFPLNVH
jgi:hypothetical protein